jgi:hypothetical protein
MLDVRVNTTAGEEPVDPGFGTYLIDVSTGQVTYLAPRPVTSQKPGFRPAHLSYEPTTQQKRSGR